MNSLDMTVTIGGIIYGVVLVMAVFVRTRLTEALRVDALFMSNASEKTRPLNLLVGLLVAGYGIYSLSTK